MGGEKGVGKIAWVGPLPPGRFLTRAFSFCKLDVSQLYSEIPDLFLCRDQCFELLVMIKETYTRHMYFKWKVQ